MTLTLEPNMTDADAFYEALVLAHENLSDEQSAALNARLVFCLANQIGDIGLLKACIDAASLKASGTPLHE